MSECACIQQLLTLSQESWGQEADRAHGQAGQTQDLDLSGRGVCTILKNASSLSTR